jgi:hypothetical protein
MRIRVQSNVPDAWVIGAIVLAGAAIVLAISALRLGTVDPRPLSPVDAPTVAPTAMTTSVPATPAPTSSAGMIESTGAPIRTFVPADTPLPGASSIPGKKTPDLPPPGYHLSEQD